MQAAGAAIGTAFAPGIGTAIGGVAGALLDGPMTGSSGTGPAGTSSAAVAVYGSGIPKHNVIMHKAVGIVSVEDKQVKPERVTARVTTADFFAAFDVPFQYGGTWTDSADTGIDKAIILRTVD